MTHFSSPKEERRIWLLSRAFDYEEAKGYEYWKKRNEKNNLGLTEEELEEKAEAYALRKQEIKDSVDALIMGVKVDYMNNTKN